MIEFLSGTLTEALPTHAVIQTGGIGWRLPITLAAYDRLPAPGEPVTLPTHLAVREDSLTLYGFADTGERMLFEQLIQVSGIGPKLAMTALSGLPGGALARAIVDGDAKRLSGISGIGKKMAERMVVELKDKVAAAGEPEGGAAAAPESSTGKTARDAILALVALGYKQQEARTLVDRIPESEQEGLPVEELVRRVLRPA